MEFKKNDMIFTQDAMIGIEQSLKKCIFNRMRLQDKISHVDDVLIDLMRQINQIRPYIKRQAELNIILGKVVDSTESIKSLQKSINQLKYDLAKQIGLIQINLNNIAIINRFLEKNT